MTSPKVRVRDAVDVVSSDLGELGNERAREGAAARVLDPTEVTGHHVEERQIRGRIWLSRIVDDNIEEDKQRRDRDSGDDPAKFMRRRTLVIRDGTTLLTR